MCSLYVSLLFPIHSFAQADRLPVEEIYKQVDTVRLGMMVYKPDNFTKTERYPAIVFFFGGGWIDGNRNQFKTFAEHFASRGIFSVLVDYRVKTRQGTTPFEALKDAKSAIRYLRKNAERFGIDAQRIVAAGGSAGGHLAAACYTNESINEESGDPGISSKPNALVLFNPVIDNSKEGYGNDRIGERYLEFSPLHNITKGFPPTVFFLGTKDKLVPVTTAKSFKQKIESLAGRCDLFLYENQEHGFFNQKIFHKDILSKVDAFLQSIGYIN